MTRRVVIIGGGLGGLTTAAILAKNGFATTLLEQSNQIGGCLQCFVRRAPDGRMGKFETGMHFIGQVGEGRSLRRILDYLEITADLHFAPLATDAYNVVSLTSGDYAYAQGEAFVSQMAEYFPSQRDNIVRYYNLCSEIARASDILAERSTAEHSALETQYRLAAADGVIRSLTADHTLQSVLSGILPLYDGRPGKTPFNLHALIFDFYNTDASRIASGSDQIARSLVRTIEKYGGEVKTRRRATQIVCNDSQATSVRTNTDEEFAADIVVAAIHPSRLVGLLSDTRLIRPAYRSRIADLSQTMSCFVIYLHFAAGKVAYRNSNYYVYSTDPWKSAEHSDATWPHVYMYMHFNNRSVDTHAETGVIIAYMRYDEVARWSNSTVGHRGADYEEFKHRKAEKLLSVWAKKFPTDSQNVVTYYTSTPLTWRDYTGTEGGSLYGIMRDIDLGAAGRISHKTRIPNVFLAGQNINSHGMQGTLVGTLLTTGEIVGIDNLRSQILKN